MYTPLCSGGPPSSSSMAKRVHCGMNSVPPLKIPVMPALGMLEPCFSSSSARASSSLGVVNMQLDVVPGMQNRNGLLDAMLLVGFELFDGAAFDELDNPARIQIDAEADAAAMLGQVLDGQTQAARAGGPEHQPIGAFGKILYPDSDWLNSS